MTAWSDYLREQALVADRVASSAINADSRREFEDIAASYRRDADIEDATSGSDDSVPLPELPERRRTSQSHTSC
ncbi:MAG: hypothetical protein ABWY64_27415 [Tardiphaga sp.]